MNTYKTADNLSKSSNSLSVYDTRPPNAKETTLENYFQTFESHI